MSWSWANSADRRRLHVINGRFQPFHLGHLEYAVAAAADCDVLVVGLTRVPGLEIPEEGVTAAPHRLSDDHNPLTFGERALIVQATLETEPEIRCDVVIVPFPIEKPHVLRSFVPPNWHIVTTLHEPWNREKIRILSELGYNVSVVCEGSEKLARGQDIRGLMRAGDESWRAGVPAMTARMLDTLDVPRRMQGGTG